MVLVALFCHVAWLLPHYIIGVVLLLRCLVIILLSHCWFCLIVLLVMFCWVFGFVSFITLLMLHRHVPCVALLHCWCCFVKENWVKKFDLN
jgi:hypothetical protein